MAEPEPYSDEWFFQHRLAFYKRWEAKRGTQYVVEQLQQGLQFLKKDKERIDELAKTPGRGGYVSWASEAMQKTIDRQTRILGLFTSSK